MQAEREGSAQSQVLNISLVDGEGWNLEQIRTFLESSEDLGFRGRNRDEVYRWVDLTLRQQGYQALQRSGRGLVRRYLEKTTGLSRAGSSPALCASNSSPQIWFRNASAIWLRVLLWMQTNRTFFFIILRGGFWF